MGREGREGRKERGKGREESLHFYDEFYATGRLAFPDIYSV